MTAQGTSSPVAPPEGAPGRALLRPRLRPGFRLLGAMEDTSFAQQQFLLRTPDGQFVRLSELLYRVAEAADGARDLTEMAAFVSTAVGKDVSADNVAWLLEQKLPWVVQSSEEPSADEAGAPPPARDALLALRFRKALVSERTMRFLSAPLRFLFSAPAVLAVVVVGIFANWWLWQTSTLTAAYDQMITTPLGPLVVILLFLAGTAFHEIGHSTALRAGGGNPGVMGAGLYLAWPAFYTDVSDSYRLSRWSRVRVDLGGIWFNLVFSIVMVGLAELTGYQPLLFVAILAQVEAIHQLLPLVRLDGYWLLADLLGVPDLFSHVRTHAAAVRASRKGEASWHALRRGPTRVFTIYVATIMPVMLVFLGALVLNAPRMIGSAFQQETKFLSDIANQALGGDEVGLLTTVVSALVLLLGPIAISLSIWLFFSRSSRQLRTWGAKSVRNRLIASGVSLAVLIGLFFAWVPADRRSSLPEDVVGVVKTLGDQLGDLRNRDDPTIHVPTGAAANR